MKRKQILGRYVIVSMFNSVWIIQVDSLLWISLCLRMCLSLCLFCQLCYSLTFNYVNLVHFMFRVSLYTQMCFFHVYFLKLTNRSIISEYCNYLLQFTTYICVSLFKISSLFFFFTITSLLLVDQIFMISVRDGSSTPNILGQCL